jgi:translation initiation factor 3 subunit A
MARFQRGATFLKPENALKRCEELIQVGQKTAALNTLHDVIVSKRYRTWQKVLELIMFKYVDLCVELKKGRMAKDGLIHYRNICQQVNVQSLEEVIKYYLKTTTDRAEEAQSKAKACVQQQAYFLISVSDFLVFLSRLAAENRSRNRFH